MAHIRNSTSCQCTPDTKLVGLVAVQPSRATLDDSTSARPRQALSCLALLAEKIETRTAAELPPAFDGVTQCFATTKQRSEVPHSASKTHSSSSASQSSSTKPESATIATPLFSATIVGCTTLATSSASAAALVASSVSPAVVSMCCHDLP